VPSDATSGPAAGLRGRAARDVLFQLAGRAFNLALGVVVTAVVARALGGEGFGQWSTILVVAQMADFLANLGVEQVGVRRAAGEPEREADWIGAVVVIRALLSIPATIASAVAVVLLALNDEMLTAGLLISSTVLLAGPGSSRALLQTRVRNDLSIAAITFNSFVWTGAAIALALADAGMAAFAFAFMVAAFATAGLQVALALRVGPIHLRGVRPLLRPLARVGLPLAVSGLLILAYARIDQLLVFELAGSEEAGLYAVAYRVMEQSHFLPLAVTTTLLPLLSAAYPSDPQRVREMLQRAGDYLMIASLPLFAFTLAASEPLIRVLFGEPFTPASPALPVLMAAFVFVCLGYLTGNLVVVLGLQRRFLVYATVGLVVNVALNLALVPEYGFLAAAWVTLGTELVVVSLTGADVARRLEFRPRLGRIGRALLAAAGMAGAVWGLDEAGAPFAVLLVAGGVYPALVLALGAITPSELRLLLARGGRPA
jgi:O-antigen/teichoic acid export membrane protein